MENWVWKLRQSPRGISDIEVPQKCVSKLAASTFDSGRSEWSKALSNRIWRILKGSTSAAQRILKSPQKPQNLNVNLRSNVHYSWHILWIFSVHSYLFEIYLLENTQHIFFIYCRMKILAFEFSSFNFAFCRCHIVAAVRSMLQRTSEALLLYAFNTCEFSSFSESGNISAVAPTMPIYPQPTPTH